MPYFYINEVISTAIKFIDEYGYVSSKSSNKPTWKLVDQYINENVKCHIEGEDSINHIKIRNYDESTKIINWIRSNIDRSEYMSTAKEIINRGYCGRHLFSLITSLIPIYRKRCKHNFI